MEKDEIKESYKSLKSNIKIYEDFPENIIFPIHELYINNTKLPKLYKYSTSTFIDTDGTKKEYPDCVENTLLQFFKIIYWDPTELRYNTQILELSLIHI